MNTEIIALLEEASSKLGETEEILAQVQKAVDVPTIPTEKLTSLVKRYRTAQEQFESQRLKIFTTLVNITLLLPTTRFSGYLYSGATSDSVCIEPLGELKIKVWKVVPYKEKLMTPEDFVKNYPTLCFSRSLIYQIQEAIDNLKKVNGDTETLQEVAKLYQGLATVLVDV